MSLNLNGTNQYISVPDNPILNPVNEISFCGWMKKHTSSGDPNCSLIHKGWSSHVDPFYQYSFDWQGVYSQANLAIGGTLHYIYATLPHDAESEFFVCVTYDGSTFKEYLWQDGVEIIDANMIESTSGLISTYTNPLEFGRSTNQNLYANATIWDTRVYNRGLSSSEVHNIFNSKGNDNITNGLIGRWLMNENPGVSAEYLIGPLEFNGSSTYYTIPESPKLNVTSITIMGRARVDAFSNYNQLIGKSDQNGGTSESWDINTNAGGGGNLTFLIRENDGTRLDANVPAASVPAGEFFFAGTYTPGQKARFWINDTVYESAGTGVLPMTQVTVPLTIGSDSNLAYGYFDGMLRDVKLYNKALTDTQIASGYSGIEIIDGLVGRLIEEPREGTKVPIFHNKLNSNYNIQHSEVGVDGTIVGAPIFSPVKHGDGISINNTNYPSFNGLISAAQMNKPFTIEFWYKPSYNSDVAAASDIVSMLTANPNYEHIEVLFANGIITLVTYNPTEINPCIYNFDASSLWSSGDLVHFGTIFDTNAGDTHRCRLFINNVESLTLSISADNAWVMDTDMWMRSWSNPNNGYLNSLKIWDYAKTDFSDRFIDSDYKSEDCSGTKYHFLPTLHNKLGSESEVATSTIGVSGTITGTLSFISSGMFGGAVYIPYDPSLNNLSFPNMTTSSVGYGHHTFEAWIKTDYSVVAGHSDDGNIHHIYRIGQVDFLNHNTCTLYIWHGNDGDAGMWAEYYDDAGNYYGAGKFDSANIAWPANTLTHIAFVVAPDSQSIYINGILAQSKAGTFPVWANVSHKLYMGETLGGTDVIFAGNGFSGYMDNVKIYNYIKTDFSDRNDEFGKPLYKPTQELEGLILWNKLGSTDITNSNYGPNGVIIGAPTFSAAKFKEGILSQADGNGAVFRNAIGFTEAEFTIEYWFNTPFFNVTNGLAADSSLHFNISWWDSVGGGWGGVTTVYNYGGGYGPGIWIGGINEFFNTGTWLANTLHHAAFVFNVAGIDSTANTFRYYLDGDLVASSNTVYTPAVTSNARIGVGGYMIGAEQLGEYSNTIIDNIKVYNYAKTDFSDRFIEGIKPRSLTGKPYGSPVYRSSQIRTKK